MTVTPASMVDERPTSRAIARTVFIVVLCVVAVYLVYLLRTPIALLAIPGAATIQIALREYFEYKGMLPRPVDPEDRAIPAA